jgi:hypothetical protein
MQFVYIWRDVVPRCNNICVPKYSTCGSEKRINIPNTSIDYQIDYYVIKYFNSFRLTRYSKFETSYDSAGSAYRGAIQVHFFRNLTDFHETRHEYYAMEGYHNAITFTSLYSLITARWTHEVVRWVTRLYHLLDARASHHRASICTYPCFLGQQLVGLSNVRLLG